MSLCTLSLNRANNRDYVDNKLLWYFNTEDALRQHNLMEFSTPLKDNDLNDGYNCSASHEAGWWYTDCKFALLTAKFGPYNTISKYKGITWFPDCDGSHFATYARMMIKPT